MYFNFYFSCGNFESFGFTGDGFNCRLLVVVNRERQWLGGRLVSDDGWGRIWVCVWIFFGFSEDGLLGLCLYSY